MQYFERYNQNAFKGQFYNDGVLTSRNTFQKYYTQAELKHFIDQTLEVDSIAVGAGLFFVFRDSESEQRFLVGRQRSRANFLRLAQRERIERIKQPSKREQRYEAQLAACELLRERWLELGRAPHQSEVTDVISLLETFGSLSKALRFVESHTDAELLLQAQTNRSSDLKVYFALHAFSRRKPYKAIKSSLQRDIKLFFATYAQALEEGRALLFQLGNTQAIQAACEQAAQQKLGYLDEKLAFYVTSQAVESLSPLLRVYIGCAALLYGDTSQVDLIKIHSISGKLSLMRYDDFYAKPIPCLLERIKIKFRSLDFEYFQYGDDYEPSYLYLKSRFLTPEIEHHEEQCAFDAQLQALELFDFKGYGTRPEVFRTRLAQARWSIQGFNLERSQQIPSIDEPCGQFLTYRDLIECSQQGLDNPPANLPKQPDSYTALYELATHVLDPIIDYFGMIELKLGFCSPELAKLIPAIKPKIDQHLACERNRLGNLICSAQGASVNFMIQDENMLEVAEWVIANLAFDQLVFSGHDQPLTVSFGPLNRKKFAHLG